MTTHPLPRSNNKARREAISAFALRLGQLCPAMNMGELSAVLLAARMLAKAPQEANDILPRVEEAVSRHGLHVVFGNGTLALVHNGEVLTCPLY